jgi:hypothetical protein
VSSRWFIVPAASAIWQASAKSWRRCAGAARSLIRLIEEPTSMEAVS